MSTQSRGPVRLAVAIFGSVLLVACGGKSASYGDVYLSADDIRVDTDATAYDVLANHRKLIVTESGIGFKGGSGSAADNTYYVPRIVINDDVLIQNPILVLRLIPADDVKEIRLYYADEVPIQYRVLSTAGGVIAINTKSGTKPPG